MLKMSADGPSDGSDEQNVGFAQRLETARPAICHREFTLQGDRRRFGDSSEHEHTKTEIGVIFEPGVGVLSCRDASGKIEEHLLSGPAVYVVPPRVAHSTRWEVRGEFFCGHVEQCFWNRDVFRARFENIRAGSIAPARNDLVLWEFATLLGHVWDEPGSNDDRPLSWLADGFLTRAGKLLLGEPVGVRSIGTCLTPSSRHAMDAYIDRQLPFNLHTPDVAKSVGLSVPQFTTVLKNSTGMTPHEYITRFRMLKAHQLLASGDHRLSEVANAVGYDDPSHFSRKFRKFFNFPPRSLMLRGRDQSGKRPEKP